MVKEKKMSIVCNKNIKTRCTKKGKRNHDIDVPQLCNICMNDLFPFNKLSDNEFQLLNRYGIINIIEESSINLL